MSRLPVFLCLALVLLLAPAHALAWGPLGHRLVARLAEYQLSPGARAEARRLLATEGLSSLADVANWADELRQHDPALGRRSSKWHYVNIGEDGCHYDAARHCHGGDCVVEALAAQVAILRDRSRPDAERLQALKFVVHLVGDVHQPLHAGYARDRGGNDFQVNFRGRGGNLHSLWDSTLLGSRGVGETAYYLRLRLSSAAKPQTDDAFSAAAPAHWAGQSCAIVVQPGFYPPRARIDDSYVTKYRPVAERQLQRAGARLAVLLNGILGA